MLIIRNDNKYDDDDNDNNNDKDHDGEDKLQTKMYHKNLRVSQSCRVG